MRKSNKKIIALILCAALTVTMAAVLTSCGGKASASTKEFKQTMKSKGFTVSDETKAYAQFKYVDKATLAVSEKMTYQVEFFVTDSQANAEKGFKTEKGIFKDARDMNDYSETALSGSNYNYYSCPSGSKYMVVSQIGNTMFVANVNIKYQKAVEKIMDTLGY